MPQTAAKSPWDQFPIAPENSAAAANIDGGGGGDWNSFAPADAPQPAQPPQGPARIILSPSGQPMPTGNPATGNVADLGSNVVFGDGAGAEARPNLSLAPEQADHLRNMLATGQGTPDQIVDAALAYVKSAGYPINEAGVRPSWLAIVQNRKANGVGGLHYTDPQPIVHPNQTQATVQGAASFIPGANKLESLIDSASVALGLGGQGDPNHTFAQNYYGTLDRAEATDKKGFEEHPWFYRGGELAGLALTFGIPTGVPEAAARAGAEAGTNALRTGATMAEARAAANTAARGAAVTRGAGEGAVYGGVTGAADSDNLPDALRNGTIGAVEGAIAGGGGAWIGGRFVRPSDSAAVRNSATSGQDALAAADNLAPYNGGQPLDLLPADVGGPVTRRATSVAAQTIAGGQPIINAGARLVNQGKGVRDTLATAAGAVLEPEALGNDIRSGADSFIASSRDSKNALYKAAEGAAGDTQVVPTKAIEALDANIAELNDTPGGAPGLEELQALRDQLAKRAWPVTGMRQMRTVLRDSFMKNGLRGSDTERRVNEVLDAAKTDVVDALNSAGRSNAATLYGKADDYARERIQTIDQVLTPILGKKDNPRSGEQVAKTLMADLQGNNARSVRLLNTLPEDVQGNVRGSIIGGLGAVDKQGNGFSLDRFLTNWNSIGKTARRAYFGSETTAALDDLARVADASKQAMKYANRSNTGGVIGNLATLATGAASIPSFVVANASEYAIGRLLASPRFARWLARAPRTSLSQPAYIDRLSRIARAEPQIAGNVLDLQRRLTDAFSGKAVPLRAAAQQNQPNASVPDWDSPQYDAQDNSAYPAAPNNAAPNAAPAYDPASDPSSGSPYADGTDGNQADWANQ